MQEHSVADKVVAVTGASAGLGKATAQRFVNEGAKVVMLARGRERLEQAAAEMGKPCTAIACDVSDPASVRSAFGQIDAQFGRLDVLINVAGIARVRLIEEASDEDIAAVMGTNFLGPIYTIRAAIPLMKRTGAGDIVNVSSEVTLDDMPLMTLYSSSKRGLDGLTRTLTKELRPDNIRVSLAVMGTVGETAFTENFTQADIERAFPAWEADGYLVRVAGAARPMDASTVADALLYLVTRPPGVMLDVMHIRSTG